MREPSRSYVTWGLAGGMFLIVLIAWIPLLRHHIDTLQQSIASSNDPSLGSIMEHLTASSQAAAQAAQITMKEITGKDVAPTDIVLQQTIEALIAKAAPAKDTAFPEAQDTGVKNIPPKDPIKATCTRAGGRYEDRTAVGGIVFSACVFADGSECEAQTFAASECAKGQYKDAAQSIQRVVDLAVSVKKAGYCNGKSSPIEWRDEEKGSPYICLDGVTTKNIGWLRSPQTATTIAGNAYTVPALAPGESYTFSSPAYVRLIQKGLTVKVTVDAANAIKESREDNNTYTFPQEIK